MLEQIPPDSIEHLYGPEAVPYAEDELVLLCLLRDGRPYIKSFVEHHFSLGVKHLFFLDNGSTDGTVEAFKEYDNVTVLRTRLPFKEYQLSMRQYLIERFAKKGRWCLCVDIDELFDYPYSDVVSLGSLLRYLNERSYTAVVAQMLDMFPEEPLSDAASEESQEDEPLKERHRFYDISNVHGQYYSDTHPDERDHYAYRHGLFDVSDIVIQDFKGKKVQKAQDHWAYRRACGTGNVLANEEIEVYKDGIQDTVFGDAPPLTKHPLVFLDEKIKPMDTSPHSVSEARIADFTCVLYHYKFLSYLYKLVQRAVRQDRYGHKRHEKWLEVLEKTPNLLVKGENARELTSVNELVENLFLVVSEEYMMFVYDEERKGAAQGSSHALPGKPGGLEDEAFYRARAGAMVQRLKARRFKQQIEEHRKQNIRQQENLRKQEEKLRKQEENLWKQEENLRKQEENLRKEKENLRKETQRRVTELLSALAKE